MYGYCLFSPLEDEPQDDRDQLGLDTSAGEDGHMAGGGKPRSSDHRAGVVGTCVCVWRWRERSL